MAAPFGIVIVAGGRATRLPGKLTVDAGGVPMVERVLRNVRSAADEMCVATSAELAATIGALVDVPVVVDGECGRGPIAGMLAAFATMRASRIFVVAGDAPFVDAAFALRLERAWVDGDRALVPRHTAADGTLRTEPLAAFYDRAAFLREGAAVLASGRGAVHLVVERLRARYVDVQDDARRFANVNTPADYAELRERLALELEERNR